MKTWQKKAPNRNVGEKRVRTRWKWTGKRMGYGRAGSSGLSRRFLKHRPRNVGYFWIQHCDSLSHAMLLNTTEEGFKDAYEHVRAETRLLIYRRHLKITGVAKNKPWILPMTQNFQKTPDLSRNSQKYPSQFPIWLSDVAALGSTLHNEYTEGKLTYLFWGTQKLVCRYK